MPIFNRKLHLKRRTFLGVGFVAAAGGAALSCKGGAQAGNWRFFTAEEGGTVDAIAECLIPRDQDPGAHEAGVVNYIDIQLTKAFKKQRSAYRKGVATVNAISQRRFQKAFVELPGDRQVEVLQDVEREVRPFFQMILAHTQQGFYGDPRHGGNRHMVSWKMVGLDYPQIRGRQRYDASEGVR